MHALIRLTTPMFLALSLLACGSPSPVDETREGTLEDDDPRVEDDNSPYDEYQLDVGEGWRIEAEMTSSDFDPYLWLIGPDGHSIVQDDDGGEGLTARFEHTATAAGTYTVRANSYDGTGRGAYRLTYSAEPGSGQADEGGDDSDEAE